MSSIATVPFYRSNLDGATDILLRLLPLPSARSLSRARSTKCKCSFHFPWCPVPCLVYEADPLYGAVCGQGRGEGVAVLSVEVGCCIAAHCPHGVHFLPARADFTFGIPECEVWRELSTADVRIVTQGQRRSQTPPKKLETQTPALLVGVTFSLKTFFMMVGGSVGRCGLARHPSPRVLGKDFV